MQLVKQGMDFLKVIQTFFSLFKDTVHCKYALSKSNTRRWDTEEERLEDKDESNNRFVAIIEPTGLGPIGPRPL